MYRWAAQTLNSQNNCSWFVVSSCLLWCASTYPVTAQISSDGTLPTQVKQSDNLTEIIGGEEAGNNLFHSFAEFSVLNGGEVWFNNATDIQNIISRVTGGSISTINGLIRANGNANLFLLNPSGIIFGPQASVNIGGSFLASTASSIRFGDDIEFSTTDTQSPPLLSVNIPLGLQFGSNPAAIQVQGSLLPGAPPLIPAGKTLGLVGGDITLESAALVAPDGQIVLGGVDSNSFVSITPTTQGFSLGYEDAQQLKNVQLQSSLIDASGLDGGGNVEVRGRNVTLDNSAIFVKPSPLATQGNGGVSIQAQELLTIANGSAIQTITSSSATGADVRLKAANVTIQNGLIFSPAEFQPTLVSAETQGSGTGGNLTIQADIVEVTNFSLVGTEARGIGKAGDISINTENLLVQDAQIVSRTALGGGLGGNLAINASDTVELVGTVPIINLNSGLVTETEAAGSTGNLTLNTSNLFIRDGGQISSGTFGSGDVGEVTIQANDINLSGISTTAGNSGILSEVRQGATGKGGDITIEAEALTITDGAQITSSTFSAGDGGSLFVNVSDLVEIQTIGTRSGLFAQVEPGATGAGGSVSIETNQLTLQGDLARISATTGGSGLGGNVTIATARLLVMDGAQIQAATLGRAAGGKVAVNASDFIQLIGTTGNDQMPIPSGLFTSTGTSELDGNLGTATAGSLVVQTENLTVQDGARISASTSNQGQGGTITIHTSDAVEIVGTSIDGQLPSGLFVEATDIGQAGNVNLVANYLLLDQGGAIVAETVSDDGGNINLEVDDTVILRNHSLISATAGTVSGQGNGGNIDINSHFLIAIPAENSDVTANAFQGQGGNIQITAQGVFGLEFRQQRTSLSDITASSRLGVDGVVEINNPEVSPSEGLIELPKTTIDVANLVVQSCNFDDNNSSGQLVVTGRGGLPPNPSTSFSEVTTLVDLGSSTPLEIASSTAITTPIASKSSSTRVIEAQGWIVNARGNVVLTAKATAAMPDLTWSKMNLFCQE